MSQYRNVYRYNPRRLIA